MILAVGISVILLILAITGGILYYQFANPPYKPPPKTQQQAPRSAPTQQVKAENAPISVAVGELEVQIVYATSSATKAQEVRTKLASTRFKTVTLQLQNNFDSTQPLLLFSPRVDAQTKTSITTSIQQVLGNVVIQEKDQTAPDISIILGR